MSTKAIEEMLRRMRELTQDDTADSQLHDAATDELRRLQQAAATIAAWREDGQTSVDVGVARAFDVMKRIGREYP